MTAWLLALHSFLIPDQPPLAKMIPEGGFREDGELCRNLAWTRPHKGEIAFDSGAGPQTGVVRSEPFQLPSEIHFFSMGYLSRKGLRVYLENERDRSRLELTERLEPGLQWSPRYYLVPAKWRGQTARLVAEDNGTGRDDSMGITAPKAGGEPWVFSSLRAANRTSALLFIAILFLLPGTSFAMARLPNAKLDFVGLAATVLCGSGVVSYLAFWVYLANAQVGKAFGVLSIAGSILFVIAKRRLIFAPSEGSRAAVRETGACLSAMVLVAVFYGAMGYLFLTDDGPGEQAQVRYTMDRLPPDNLLPDMLAERLYKGKPVKPTLFDMWHSSDRPPLQAGAALLMFPFSPLVRELSYQLLSVFLQCMWLPGLWILARSAGLGNRYLIPLIGFAVFSHVCILHSFFVWPKMFAAGYVLIGMAFLFRHEWTVADSVLSSSAIALGLLGHTGVIFTVIPVCVFACRRKRLWARRQVFAAFAAGLLLLLPWRWYQTVYDPPGDFLLKFNMTNAQDPVRIQRPFGELLRESYASVPPASLLEYKIADLKAMFYGDEIALLKSGDLGKALDAFQYASFLHVFWSLALLNVGFVCRIFARPSPAIRFADSCLWIVGFSMVVWVLALFPAHATVIHQWSLANMLLLILILTVYMVESRIPLVYPVLAAETFVTFPITAFAKPLTERTLGVLFDAPPDFGMAAVTLISFCALMYAAWRAKLQEVS